ncbi:DUF2537 domain-containing protein [Haloactinomyces albus]|uniref:DUF2537 domain-containing protein n=1 Tax=Haloactinomyces albus TaxID=1352928 RepID=A0AAE3ZEF1_9ACTN|nr:DUF2537 domain-containing protein [Haloactinomyces albus]MDR7301484.1 hypothetical protein [Haloactinomyces albus]
MSRSVSRARSTAATDTGTRESTLELRARSGRAVLLRSYDHTERDPAHLPVSGALLEALHEWAHVAGRVAEREGADADFAARAVERRGRQLATRLAAEIDVAVEYVDPSSGQVHRAVPQRLDREGPEDTSRWTSPHARSVGQGLPATGEAEPTPWATGLTVSALVAALVTIALVIVSSGLAEVSVLLALIVNAAMAAGFAPSIWLGRRVPVWRWVALGTAGGILLAWFALLLDLLG